MTPTRICWLAMTSVSVLAARAWEPVAQAQGPESHPATRPTTQPAEPQVAESQLTTQPAASDAVVLSAALYPAEVTDEAQYVRHTRQRTDALIEAAGRASDAAARIEHHLAAANWILACQIEPQITRLLLGIDEPGDTDALAASVALAQQQLDTAGCLLADLADQAEIAAPPSDDQQPEEDSQPMAGRLEALHSDLSAFAEALATIAADTSDDQVVQRARRSASQLGVLLEDTRPGVAPAAIVYQALLFARIGRMDRAMTVLDLALRPLPADAEALSFFGRLLRCRFLARQGAYAVAWSLLLKLEERCQEWFDTPQARAEATATVAVVRLEVARSWKESLAEAGAADGSAWCEAAERRIGKPLFGGDESPTVMRIGHAVPMLTDLPDAPSDNAQPPPK